MASPELTFFSLQEMSGDLNIVQILDREPQVSEILWPTVRTFD